MRRFLTSVVAAAAAVSLATACGSDQSAAPAPTTTTTATAPSESATEDAPESPTGSPTTSPAPQEAPSATPEKLKRGVKGDRVVALQQRLTELGYWNGGEADGSFGALTQQAVYALQKAAGLTRDGVVGTKTQKALDQGVRPKAKSDDGRVIEISKKKQLLMLVNDGEVEQVFNTSTGSYERYEQDGASHIAATPSGKFTVSRQIDGWRDAPLGLLWRPKYFNGGIAVHGAYSIPPYAASHGCARVSIPAMNHLWKNGKIPIDTKVWVY
ncbi:L,D-transpeptidase family protein [Symbioplanes lichenis]|uniref:L,D-transpeptidase family protein n=1 Tax=Symbioplanes lichenis TaxID=1629072 RepID=UPI00273A30D9|nr:L,D-transpeptidase family protein [Actinoplanes lichenis]